MRRLAASLVPCTAVLFAMASATPALAHGTEVHGASEAGWRIAVAVPLVLAGFTYARGLRRAWRRAGAGRGVRPAEALAFSAGLAVLAVMLALPLHEWGGCASRPTCSSTSS